MEKVSKGMVVKDRDIFYFSNRTFWLTSLFVFLIVAVTFIYGVLVGSSKSYIFAGIFSCYLTLSFLSNTYATKKVVIDWASGQMTFYARCSKNDEIILINEVVSAESGIRLGRFSAAKLTLYMRDKTTKRYIFDVEIQSKSFFSLPREVFPHELSKLVSVINKSKNE